MIERKTPFEASGLGGIDSDSGERQVALEYLAEAWSSAEEDGVDGRTLAEAALYAALVTLVELHGDEAAAEMAAELPRRILAGDYSPGRVVQ